MAQEKMTDESKKPYIKDFAEYELKERMVV